MFCTLRQKRRMRRIAPPPAPLTRAANAQTGLTEVPTPSSHPSRSAPPTRYRPQTISRAVSAAPEPAKAAGPQRPRSPLVSVRSRVTQQVPRLLCRHAPTAESASARPALSASARTAGRATGQAPALRTTPTPEGHRASCEP